MIHFSLKKTYRVGPRIFELDVEYSLPQGRFLGIWGPSGSGKSTVLRCLAGLIRPDSGLIRTPRETWFDSLGGGFVPPQKRSVGLVFQDFALFPHLTVLGNLLYAHPDRSRAQELLAMTHLEDCAHHLPRELSGGQKQRCALARALMRGPEILLLDEPLSALDEELRDRLAEEIRSLQRTTGTTAIVVSHSRREIDFLSTEVLELRDGRSDSRIR